jgi:hypothetical protein
MSRRSGVFGLALAALLLANGLTNKASADLGACKPVKACAPVTAVPACKPVQPLPAPAACKPVKPLPGACKPVKEYGCVEAHPKHVALHNHVARFVSHFHKHGTGKEVYYDAPQPATSSSSPTPAPAPQPPTS